jgi:hypothetical protein
MSYGFEAFDAAGRLLLSDAAGSYGYRGTYATAAENSGYVTPTTCGNTSLELAATHGRGNWVCTIPKSAFPSPPLLTFELPTYPNGCAMNGLQDDGTNWRFWFLSTVQPVVHAFGVFTDEAKSTTGMGIQVFDSNGLLTFDSIARRPLQLLRVPLQINPAAFAWNMSTGLLSAANDAVIAPGVALPANVLMFGAGYWEGTCETDVIGGGGKTEFGDIRDLWWRIYGRDGNDIRLFGYNWRRCSASAPYSLHRFASPLSFSARLMLIDRSLYE